MGRLHVKLKLTVADTREARDVLVTADVTATIADIAGLLQAVHPQVPDETQHLTLRVEFPGRRQGRVLNAGAQVHESSLRSGCRVEVVPVGERRAGDERDDAPAAVVRVLSGPQAG